MLVPAAVIERLPFSLWRAGNLRLGNRLHFCYGGGAERTVEWAGRTIGHGNTSRLDEMEQHQD